jgi:hypothetical protein
LFDTIAASNDLLCQCVSITCRRLPEDNSDAETRGSDAYHKLCYVICNLL